LPPANNILREKIAQRLTRPVERAALINVKRFYEDFEYQAASRDKERRVIANIDCAKIDCVKIDCVRSELFPYVGFIVTNLTMEPDWIVHFCNQPELARRPLAGKRRK